MSDKFDWAGSNVVARSYGDIAVYINPYGDIVVRQNDPFDTDDQLVIVPLSNAELIAETILARAKESQTMEPPEAAEPARQPTKEPELRLALPAPGNVRAGTARRNGA